MVYGVSGADRRSNRPRLSPPRSLAVEAALERVHDLRGTLEAFGVRLPDLRDHVLRGAVALGGRGHLLLLCRDVHTTWWGRSPSRGRSPELPALIGFFLLGGVPLSV